MGAAFGTGLLLITTLSPVRLLHLFQRCLVLGRLVWSTVSHMACLVSREPAEIGDAYDLGRERSNGLACGDRLEDRG